VFLDGLKQRAEFHAEFGPFYAVNFKAFLEDPETEGIRSVGFKAAQRVEMADGSPIILSVVFLATYIFLILRHL
jgi:hypothetical protein